MDNIKEIFTDKIILPAHNMRAHIDREELFELAADIKQNGLINPITVRPVGENFELVAGQRRYLAHQFAGIIKIKSIIRELTDEEALAIMTSENLSRVDVNPIDEANHIAQLMKLHDGDIKKVAANVNRSEKWVRDRVAIGSMPDYMQELIGLGQLKIGVALILAQITDDGTRKMWTFQAVRDGATIELAQYWLMDFQRRLLPGGELSGDGESGTLSEAPKAIMFRCAIDGQEYDVRTSRAIIVHEANVALFNEFVLALKEAPGEI